MVMLNLETCCLELMEPWFVESRLSTFFFFFFFVNKMSRFLCFFVFLCVHYFGCLQYFMNYILLDTTHPEVRTPYEMIYSCLS